MRRIRDPAVLVAGEQAVIDRVAALSEHDLELPGAQLRNPLDTLRNFVALSRESTTRDNFAAELRSNAGCRSVRNHLGAGIAIRPLGRNGWSRQRLAAQ